MKDLLENVMPAVLLKTPQTIRRATFWEGFWKSDAVLGLLAKVRAFCVLSSSTELMNSLFQSLQVPTLMCDNYIGDIMGRIHWQEVRFEASEATMFSAPYLIIYSLIVFPND